MADSPQPSKTPSSTARTSSSNAAPAAVQESPVFSYISNLSPIQPVKPVAVAKDLPGVDSPPFVFTSPRTIPWSKPSLPKRPQFFQSASAALSGAHQICKGVADGSGTLDSDSKGGLIPFADKESDYKSSVHGQAASPSESADAFLAEIVNTNSSDSVSSTGLNSEQSDNIPQPVDTKTDQKGSVFKVENKDHGATGACSAVSEQSEVGKELQVSDQHTKVAFDSSVNPALGNQHQEHSISDNSIAKHIPVGSSAMDTDSLSSEQKIKLQEPKFKAGQDQHGTRRRCLKFGDGKQKTLAKEPDSNNASGDVNYSSSLAESEIFDSSSLDLPATPVNEQVAKSIQPKLFPQTSGSSTLNGPKPSGIGLHLNSILNSVQRGATVSMKSMETGNFSVRGKKSISLLRCHSSENAKSYSLSSNEMEHVSAINDNDRYERDEPIAENSAMALSPCGMEPLNNSLSLKSIQQQTTICGKRNYSTPDNNNIVEESSQSSPKKKRKKMPDGSDGDGCKRCNCKKTKCLKLYCDCFAAGIYCAEPCACQGCFNRPEYEDTVLETRQQIESRNPLAFAPKIIQNVTEPITNSFRDDGACFTPSSARHKRGCNCKKSMCLKKYCECYQANVGCSDGCRCDGCKNVYGRKEEYGKRKHLVRKQDKGEACDVSFNEKLELVASRNDLVQSELCNPHNLTPLTPSLEYSNQGVDGSKFLFSSGRFLRPPDSANFLQSYEISPGSSLNCDDRDMIQDSSKGILDLVSFDQELDYGNGIAVNEVSQRYHGPGIVGHHLHSLSSPQDWSTRSQTRVISGTSHFSPGNSLHWRRSPISPMTYFEGNKFLDTMDSDTGLYKTLEDDTPDILKENITPSNAVKVSSPNKKRVSPPHARTHELVSSSSAGLKTCRKFILQAVPSFPPLTPSMEPKSEANPSTNSSQNGTSSK